MIYQTKAEMLKALGENLRAARLAANISQQTAADRSGISLKAVRNIENGLNASTVSLLLLCRTLNKVDWIMNLAPPLLDDYLFEPEREGRRRLRAMPSRKGVKHG